MLCPVLTPAELWEASGRISLPILFRLQDSSGRRFILPMSHEETMTFHARELNSYKQLPQLLVPLLHEGARRAARARRPPPTPRVHHERLVLVRPERGGARRELPAARRGVRAHLRALRRRGIPRRGGVRDHGRQGVVRLFGADGLRRERAHALRERRLLRRHRDGPGRAACARAAGAARCAARDRDARGDDDRGAGGAPGHRRGGDVEGDAGRHGRPARARSRPRRRSAERGEVGDVVRGVVPAGDGRGDPCSNSARAGAPSGRSARLRCDRGRGAARGPVRRRREPRRLAPAGRRGRSRLRAAFADIRQAREGDVCPSAVGASSCSRRSRSVTSSSSARSTPRHSARGSSTRTGRRGQ